MTCAATCPFAGVHTDAARRISDAIGLAWIAYNWDCVGKWMAFRLEDGKSTDGYAVYDRKMQAVVHVTNELQYCFIKLHPGGMGLCEAEIMLQFTRKAVAAGFRLADPDAKTGGRDVIPRITSENIRAQLKALTRGKR